MTVFHIWKYDITQFDEDGDVEVSMPKGAELLHAGLDPQGDLCVWVKVSQDEIVSGKKVTRSFRVLPTGGPFDIRVNDKYIGTVSQPNKLVFHVFERG